MLRQGGSYIIEQPGAAPRLLERTIDHPDGNQARSAPAAGQPPKDRAERIAAIRIAIERLDTAHPGHMNSAGKPRVSVLESMLGWNINHEERDEAAGRGKRSNKAEG